FFQAEDGIRDFHVTGVQTCALPICSLIPDRKRCRLYIGNRIDQLFSLHAPVSSKRTAFYVCAGVARGNRCVGLGQGERISTQTRSEERRVGKESNKGRKTDQDASKS